MKRTPSAATFVTAGAKALGLVAVALVAAAVGARAAAATDAGPHVTTLHYTLHFSPFTTIDVGAKGISLGDEIVLHQSRLLDGGQARGL